MLLYRGTIPSSSRLRLHFFFFFFLAFFLFRPTDRQTQNQGTHSTVNKKYKMALEIALPNNTLSTSFLGPFQWRGKGKGTGTKVEHTVIHVLGQYSKKYRASFIPQLNVKNISKKGRLMAV